MNSRIVLGDCRDVLPTMEAASVDAVVTDPPYALTGASRNGGPRKNDLATPFGRHNLQPKGFMGHAWDGEIPGVEVWREVSRVMKPGAHLLAFGGTRTWHRLACAIEDAGFEMRDTIMWLYGQGFPKSLNVGAAIDKAAGAAREVVGPRVYADGTQGHWGAAGKYAQDSHTKGLTSDIPKLETLPATDASRQWQGWGTALKPAWEPILVCRKPLDGTVAANVQRHGTGAVNIDGCRLSSVGYTDGGENESIGVRQTPGVKHRRCDGSMGRWPANVVLDEVAAAELDGQVGERRDGWAGGSDKPGCFQRGVKSTVSHPGYGGFGGPSRYFYCPKASRSERGEGNTHATVKPLALVRWLCRLVTPPGGLVLDPYLGSGTTLLACRAEGFRCLGIEREPEYHAIAEARDAAAAREHPLFSEVS
jgi:DNA modification methylase